MQRIRFYLRPDNIEVFFCLQIDGKFIRINGDPGPGLVEVSVNEKAAMIVMGSRGLGTIRRTLLGSVSSYVMCHASVPVIVFRK